MTRHQVNKVLSNPSEFTELDPVTLRRFAAYLLLHWLDDYKADLHGEYFPFDLPQLAFYRRGMQLESMLRRCVASPKFSKSELSTLNTMATHLRSLCDDPEIVAAAARLEKASMMFEKLRKVMRLTAHPNSGLLRQRGPLEETEELDKLQRDLAIWRAGLRKQHAREQDQEKKTDQAIVLKYLDKYETQLAGHVIEREGDHPPLVVPRTNNSIEQRFGSMKQQIRRRVGLKKLTRQIQAIRPEALLAGNLENQEYVDLVLDGSVTNLPSMFQAHWGAAQAIREARRRRQTDHPLPTTKKQLRDPRLLNHLRQIIENIVQQLAERPQAA